MTTPVLHAEFDPASGMIVYKDDAGRVFSQAPATAEEKRDAAKGLIPTVKAAEPPKPPSTPDRTTASSADGSTVTTQRDGTTITIRPDGSRVVVRPDGRRTVLDSQGNVVDMGEPTKPGDKSGRNTGITPTGKTSAENTWDKQAAATPAGQQQQLEQSAGQAAAIARYNATHPPVFINGQMAVVTSLDAAGNPATYAYTGVRDTKGNVSNAASQLGGKNTYSEAVNPTTGLPDTTAFDALHLGATYGQLAGIQGTDTFTMANGPTNILTGMPGGTNPNNPVVGPGNTNFAAAEHSDATTTVNGSSQMTIAEGVQWLAKLSAQSPDAYNELVKELKHAGYTGASGEPLTGGAYSETVAIAFAKAAKDLSVMQGSTGTQMGLDDYLKQRQAAVAQAARDNAEKAPRDYTDPGSLAATAKSAAESAIGRNLTPDELARFQAQFHSQQSSYYDQYDAAKANQAAAAATGEGASVAGPSGTMPDAGGQANALVQGDQFAGERASFSVDHYGQALNQLFGVK